MQPQKATPPSRATDIFVVTEAYPLLQLGGRLSELRSSAACVLYTVDNDGYCGLPRTHPVDLCRWAATRDRILKLRGSRLSHYEVIVH